MDTPTAAAVYDSVGRYLAPADVVLQTRPHGPWDANVLQVICAWCVGFNPKAESNRHASHTICPACALRVEAEWAA